MRKRKAERKNDTESGKSVTLWAAHLVQTMFYDEWAPSGESSVSKPQGTFIPRWEDIQDDSEPDLRGLLMWKRKRKEASALESSDTSRCVRVQTLDGRIVYKLWWCAWPTCNVQGGPKQGPHHKSLVCYVAQENSEEESNTKKEEKITAKKGT